MTNETKHTPRVGAPDPELKNSPIFDSTDGDELLRCEGRGVWIREGTCYND